MIRTIIIHPALNGFVVTAGCHSLVFSNPCILTAELKQYLENPEEVEQRYLKDAINANELGNVTTDGPCAPPFCTKADAPPLR
jgi:hypothetical protein